jgi:hypothetical protein
MYSYIYYYYCKLFNLLSRKKDKKPDVALIVFVYQLIHVLFLYACIKYFFNVSLLGNLLNHEYGTNKLIFIPILFFYTYILSWYFRKRWEKIKLAYEGKMVLDLRNAIIIISLFFLPLVITCFLSFFK